MIQAEEGTFSLYCRAYHDRRTLSSRWRHPALLILSDARPTCHRLTLNSAGIPFSDRLIF